MAPKKLREHPDDGFCVQSNQTQLQHSRPAWACTPEPSMCYGCRGQLPMQFCQKRPCRGHMRRGSQDPVHVAPFGKHHFVKHPAWVTCNLFMADPMQHAQGGSLNVTDLHSLRAPQVSPSPESFAKGLGISWEHRSEP